MARVSVSIQRAVRVYARAQSVLGSAHASAHRDEMLMTFRDACVHAEQTRGTMGVATRTVSELWDLVAARLLPRRHARVSSGVEPEPVRTPRSSNIATDVRHAWRALTARRADTVLVVSLLALGIATTSSIFAVADALLLHPVPFADADRLVQVWSVDRASGVSTTSVPRDLAVRWLDRTDLFASGGAVEQTSALVTSGGDPELIGAALVSPGLLETLGVRPILGRTFSPEEGRAGTSQVAVISEEVWVRRFGRAPDVVGRTLRINDLDHVVVGVMPLTFRFPYARQRIWLPIDIRNPSPGQERSFVSLTARMRPGITRAQLTEQIEAAGPGMATQALRPWKMGATTHFLDSRQMDARSQRSIWLLLGSTVLLMVMVCTNVANLGLSQALGRMRDAAIRSALGASRWRLIRQMMVEQVATGVMALILALPLTAGALQVANALLPETFTVANLNIIDLDARLVALMSVLAIGAPLVAGCVPALAGSRLSVLSALKQEGRSVTGSRGARWFRQALIVTEVACSVVLLITASLLVRSFIRLQSVDNGFDSRNLVSVNVGFTASHFSQGVARDLFIDSAVTRVRQLPGVESAMAADGIPPNNGGISFGKVMTDGDSSTGTDLVASMYAVPPEFFSMLRVPIRGRAFSQGDGDGHVIISQSLATKLWPGADAVGHRLKWDSDTTWSEVVGVAANLRDGNGGNTLDFPQLFTPAKPFGPLTTKPRDAIVGWRRLAVRVADPVTAMPEIRAALLQLDPAILISSVDRVDDQLAKALDRPRFLLVLMLVFAGAGLVLAAAGVYGVLSCLVSEQLREYGIRLMLGASPRLILRRIVIGGLLTTSAGLVVGVAVAGLLGRTITTVLFDVEALDVISYAIVTGVLLASALVAAWVPARRAMRVDPAALLRE